MRHEIGHCNGWGADHAGARFENVVRLPVPKPDTENGGKSEAARRKHAAAL
jgi:hypothetical protein